MDYKKYRKDQKPFTMYMPELLYKEIKSISTTQDVTMTKYILKAIVTRMNLEREEPLKMDNRKCLHP